MGAAARTGWICRPKASAVADGEVAAPLSGLAYRGRFHQKFTFHLTE